MSSLVKATVVDSVTSSSLKVVEMIGVIDVISDIEASVEVGSVV